MAEPRARRELELRLKVVADTAGAKAGMDSLAASTERVEKASNRAQRAALGGAGVGGFGAGGIGAGGAAGKPGLLGGIGEAVGARFGIGAGMAGPAAALAAAYQIARTTKAAADAYQDPYLSGTQRSREILKSLPLGETGLSYLDTITGRAADLRAAKEEGQIRSAESGARTQLQGIGLGLGAQVTTSRAQAAALAGGSATTLPYIDRSTATGERQFKLESQLLQVRERSAAASRAAEVAKAESIEADRQANALGREGEQIDRRRAGLQRQINRTGQGLGRRGLAGLSLLTSPLAALTVDAAFDDTPRRLGLQNEFADLGTERESKARLRATELERARDARVREITARAEAAKLGPERLRIESADLEERAARASSAAQRVATAGPDRIAEAIYAAERFSRRGLKSLDPSEIALLQEFGPDDLRTAAEREGKNDPRLRRLARLLPESFPDGAADPEALRRQANERRNQAAEQQFGIDRGAAAQTADTVKQVADIILKTFREVFDKVRENMIEDLKRGRGHN